MPIYVSKGGGGGGADADAIHDNVAGEIAAIAEKTAPVAADMILIEDSAAANAKKMVQFANIPPQDVSVLCTKNAAQSINNTSYTALVWQTEVFDTDAMHDTTANTNRLTAVKAGKYLIIAGIEWAANTTGDRILFIRNQDSAIIAVTQIGGTVAGRDFTEQVVGIAVLAAADWVEAVCYQTSGGALDVQDPDDRTFFGMVLTGEV